MTYLLSKIASDKGIWHVSIEVGEFSARYGVIVPEVMYPNPPEYRDMIVKYSRERGISPSMVMALIHQESRFNPRAESPVGARGLMQLMPSTAQREGRILGREVTGNVRASMLFDPELNVKLGTSYFSSRLGMFGGSAVLTVASYNAGAGRVRNWMRDLGDPRELENLNAMIDWIDSIPIAETREYVGLTAKRTIYGAMYFNDDRSLATVLKSGQVVAGTEVNGLPSLQPSSNPPLAMVGSFMLCSTKNFIALRESEIASPASLTKMMTLYLAAKAISQEGSSLTLDTMITVPSIAVRRAEGLATLRVFKNRAVQAGDQYSFQNFVQAAGGASDATSTVTVAIAAAKAFGWRGSANDLHARFVQEMRNEAARLGMKDTFFMNTTGDRGNLSTPQDMMKLVEAFRKSYPAFYEVAMGKSRFSLDFAEGETRSPSSRVLRSNPEEVLRSKTGYLGIAGFNEAINFKIKDRTVIPQEGYFVLFGADSKEERATRINSVLDTVRDMDVRQFCALKNE
jgi:hypothetical protein